MEWKHKMMNKYLQSFDKKFRIYMKKRWKKRENVSVWKEKKEKN